MKRKYFNKEELRAKKIIERLSRREFLSSAIINSTALAAAPVFVRNMLSEVSAVAETNLSNPPFVVFQFHARGGCGPWNASVPRDINQEMLKGKALGTYGVNPSNPPIVSAFQNQFFNFTTSTTNADGTVTVAKDFIDGVLTHLNTPELQGRVFEFAVAAESDDDSGTTETGCTSVLHAAGFRSAPLLYSVGFRSTETGMANSSAISYKVSPFIAQRASDIPKQAEYAVAMAVKNNAGIEIPYARAKIGKLAQALKSLSDIQLRLPSFEGADPTKADAIIAAHNENLSYVNGNAAVEALDLRTSDLNDPNDPTTTYKGLFGITDVAGQDNSLDFRLAMGLRYLLNGYTHFVGFSPTESFDYHQDDETITKAQDLSLGELVGKVAKLAIKEGKNCCVVMTTDGSVNGPPDNTPIIRALGDRGNHTMWGVWVILGNPTTQVEQIRKQIGAKKTSTGVNDTTTVTGKNDATGAAAIAANLLYLNLYPTLGSQTFAKISEILPVFRDAQSVKQNLAVKYPGYGNLS